MSSKFLKGAFILTFGSIISKVLGLFYVIPFEQWLGIKGLPSINMGTFRIPFSLALQQQGCRLLFRNLFRSIMRSRNMQSVRSYLNLD